MKMGGALKKAVCAAVRLFWGYMPGCKANSVINNRSVYPVTVAHSRAQGRERRVL
jgi:hypothetical protein